MGAGADEATLDLLVLPDALARLDARQVVLITTYRDDEVGPHHALYIVRADHGRGIGIHHHGYR
jgi:hypothetical protein